MDVRRVSLLLRDWLVNTALHRWKNACHSTHGFCMCSALARRAMADVCEQELWVVCQPALQVVRLLQVKMKTLTCCVRGNFLLHKQDW